ncbi:MAG: hypothetical protein IJX76_04505 [Clostridia bacterium]|nr:hypothetical protein [Clostridia bacterium]
MRKMLVLMVAIIATSLLLHGCTIGVEECYSEIEIGEIFGNNIDGHQKKLPQDYCLDVDLGSQTRLFKVPDDLLDKPYFSNSVYNTTAILEGHFIKGYYNADYLVLCEEKENDELAYLTFDFGDESVRYHRDVEAICELIGVDSLEWFSLCNTNQEIQRIQSVRFE